MREGPGGYTDNDSIEREKVLFPKTRLAEGEGDCNYLVQEQVLRVVLTGQIDSLRPDL